MNLLGKTICTTSMEDVRFMRGENVMDSFNRDDQFGTKHILTFEDKTYMSIEVVQIGDEHLLGVHHGHWETDEATHTIKIID